MRNIDSYYTYTSNVQDIIILIGTFCTKKTQQTFTLIMFQLFCLSLYLAASKSFAVNIDLMDLSVSKKIDPKAVTLEEVSLPADENNLAIYSNSP